jgi:hypothetical protein
MKLPLVKSALLPYFLVHAVYFGLLIFISSMVVSCLIKILFRPEQDSNLYELYSVLVSTSLG